MIWSISTSIVRPLNACATRLAPSAPTGATTFTGRIKLAASAKYTADPPSVSSTLPKGPSRVSRATEPATRRSPGCSGTSTRTTARGDYVARMAELLQEVLRAGVVLDLHPAATELACGVRIRSCCRDLPQLHGKPRCRLVFRRFAPRVVRLDDVDAVRELRHALHAEVRAMAVERMRHIGEPAHLVNHVHHIICRQVRRNPARDEQSDHLTLPRLGLFADDREVRCELSP